MWLATVLRRYRDVVDIPAEERIGSAGKAPFEADGLAEGRRWEGDGCAAVGGRPTDGANRPGGGGVDRAGDHAVIALADDIDLRRVSGGEIDGFGEGQLGGRGGAQVGDRGAQESGGGAGVKTVILSAEIGAPGVCAAVASCQNQVVR